MTSFVEPVVFEAHPTSSVMRRACWWIVPLIVLPTVGLILLGTFPAVAWTIIGCVPVVAIIVMPRLVPVRVAVERDGLRFGSGLAARHILFDRILVVDLRRTASEEELETAEGVLADELEEKGILPKLDADADASDAEARRDAVKQIAEVGQTIVEPWRVTVHSNLVPVSVALARDDATALARALHAMCPRAALWDADGRLLEPIDPAAARSSMARVRRLAVARRALSMVGGVGSMLAFIVTLGGPAMRIGGLGQILPYLWIGLGAGFFGLAAGAEKRLIVAATPPHESTGDESAGDDSAGDESAGEESGEGVSRRDGAGRP